MIGEKTGVYKISQEIFGVSYGKQANGFLLKRLEHCFYTVRLKQ